MTRFSFKLLLFVFSFTLISLTLAQQSMPEGSEQAFIRLHGAYVAYPIFTIGEQSFRTPDNILYTPLSILRYILHDTDQNFIDAENKKFSFYTKNSVFIRFEPTDGPKGNLFIGISKFEIEPLWLENDVYVPITLFLNMLNIDYIWDSVLNTLTIPNARPLVSTDFARGLRTHTKDTYPVHGVFTSAITPTDISFDGGDQGNWYLNISFRSLIDVPVGLNLRRPFGTPAESGSSFLNCYMENCSHTYFIFNYRNTDKHNIILLTLVAQ